MVGAGESRRRGGRVSTQSDVLCEFLREADRSSADALPSVVVDALRGIGVRGAVLYLIDYEQTMLLPAPGSPASLGAPEPQHVNGTPAGAACTHQEPVEQAVGDAYKLWVPVSQRADCLGVLELEVGPIDDHVRRLCMDVGVLLGHLLVTARQYTDVYELLTRRRQMNLPAEMHWETQPAMNYAGPSIHIAGGIEPSYEVGGDAYDYNINNNVIDFALLDAMGHGLEAALLSFQAVSAYRYGRRRLQTLEEVANTVETTFVRQFGDQRFVTGLLCRLDAGSGTLCWVNAGHLPPLLLRKGKVVSELTTDPHCPLGIGLNDRIEVHEISLDPGDSVVLYSDGVIEARSPDGVDFELDRLEAVIEREDLQQAPPPTLVRNVIEEVKSHCRGPLRDDATVVLVDYLGRE
jgi:serine/threonine protein phosphatase PrpC